MAGSGAGRCGRPAPHSWAGSLRAPVSALVAGAGRILLYAAGVQGTLLSSDGTKWIEETLYTKESLNGVWGTTRRTANATEVDVWVVGQKGTILRKAP